MDGLPGGSHLAPEKDIIEPKYGDATLVFPHCLHEHWRLLVFAQEMGHSLGVVQRDNLGETLRKIKISKGCVNLLLLTQNNKHPLLYFLIYP